MLGLIIRRFSIATIIGFTVYLILTVFLGDALNAWKASYEIKLEGYHLVDLINTTSVLFAKVIPYFAGGVIFIWTIIYYALTQTQWHNARPWQRQTVFLILIALFYGLEIDEILPIGLLIEHGAWNYLAFHLILAYIPIFVTGLALTIFVERLFRHHYTSPPAFTFKVAVYLLFASAFLAAFFLATKVYLLAPLEHIVPEPIYEKAQLNDWNQFALNDHIVVFLSCIGMSMLYGIVASGFALRSKIAKYVLIPILGLFMSNQLVLLRSVLGLMEPDLVMLSIIDSLKIWSIFFPTYFMICWVREKQRVIR